MKLNLYAESLFECEELEINKKITFVYGKNGTGKSTLAKLIEEQGNNYDVRIFQGFDKVVDASNRLNAVVLGEENNTIRHQIEKVENQIQVLEEQKKIIKKTVEKPEEDSSNYWTRNRDAQMAYEKKEGEIKSFYTRAAALIKNQKNPQISSTTYDTRAFQRDIPNAQLLNEKEKNQCTEILKSTPKVADDIEFPTIDVKILFEDVNTILNHKVEEKVKVIRLENHPEKRAFADMGRKIHKKGDICAFCGNLIDDDVYEELEKYFSADEVREFREKINKKLDAILLTKKMVEKLEIDKKTFYPDFFDEVEELDVLLSSLKRDYILFLERLEKALKNKLSYLFEGVSKIESDLPMDFKDISYKYNELKVKNNENDLLDKQEKARELLRFHSVKEQLEAFEFVVRMRELELLEKQKDLMHDELMNEILKLTGENGINEQIAGLQEKIVELQKETRNEKILAQNINKKLRYMVSFELEHCEDEEEKGYYLVRNIHTNETRDITKLSTGEKNIIAFLYFIEKLNEIQDNETKNKKIIVFDDPMNSNDDNMQYLIIEELQVLMNNIQNEDRFILLTHNTHFYLNVTYKRGYKDNLYLHLKSNGEKTIIKVITSKNDDFCTNYQSLWKELIFLYNNSGASQVMLLNPMRRIIETYSKFNAINHNDFCAKKSGAMKLLNVNSHSIDDLEADLCGKEKKDIADLFCACFVLNNALEHFQSFWPEYDISFLELTTTE